MTSHANEEMSLLDIADFLFDKIIYLIAGLTLGLVLAVVAFYFSNSVDDGEEINISVYGAGTPALSGPQLAEQMKFSLIKSGFSDVVQDGSVLRIKVDEDADQSKIESALKRVEGLVDGQAQETFNYLDSLEPDAKDAAVTQVYHAYVNGRAMGFIDLYSVGYQDQTPRQISLRLPLLAIFFGVLLGLGAAILSKFREIWWARRQNDK